MATQLSKTEADAFRKRWQLVNQREIEELRATSAEVKLKQFHTLLTWAQAFDREKSEADVRERWARLRKAHRG